MSGRAAVSSPTDAAWSQSAVPERSMASVPGSSGPSRPRHACQVAGAPGRRAASPDPRATAPIVAR